MITDSTTVAHLQGLEITKPRHARWLEFLSQFSFATVYRKGLRNRADALSRATPDDFNQMELPDFSTLTDVVLPRSPSTDAEIILNVTAEKATEHSVPTRGFEIIFEPDVVDVFQSLKSADVSQITAAKAPNCNLDPSAVHQYAEADVKDNTASSVTPTPASDIALLPPGHNVKQMRNALVYREASVPVTKNASPLHPNTLQMPSQSTKDFTFAEKIDSSTLNHHSDAIQSDIFLRVGFA